MLAIPPTEKTESDTMSLLRHHCSEPASGMIGRMTAVERSVEFPGPASPALTLSPLRRGGGDPCYRVAPDGAIWRTSLMRSGPPWHHNGVPRRPGHDCVHCVHRSFLSDPKNVCCHHREIHRDASGGRYIGRKPNARAKSRATRPTPHQTSESPVQPRDSLIPAVGKTSTRRPRCWWKP